MPEVRLQQPTKHFHVIILAGPVGAAAVAEAISIAPTLLYDGQAGAEAVAIGADIVRAPVLHYSLGPFSMHAAAD